MNHILYEVNDLLGNIADRQPNIHTHTHTHMSFLII